ncbi:23S rRNA (pseudouridine(1915)-N(3))-methyltransferase RlmH [Algoriphagus kandeliae]|uniref:Ribosomal RNA large subunit methyltransferase H n=1 Tax=Algoriphagus kandeliae TaxID=2562278 RepID=A0A4Y9QWJ9_9BACT|nr:23S rRNA (pseudouridine(1915)-N(3))-methyltransferase RlmH [Algoriphagus kandeliae]TFV95513.1 23S rRNA (pseudouridine(1915)-N(3))-methyltransferase RlmH [Algoriphagus kandeliae]
MQIKIIAIGKTDHPAILQLQEIYTDRLSHYIRVEWEIIPDLKNTKSLNQVQQKSKEGELILKKISTPDFVLLLDEKGKSYTSIEFADFLQGKMNSGIKQLVLVIGGPYGFSEEVYLRANSKISLSKMTFSHQMIRPFLAEQLYRAMTILRGEPYHHE